MASLRTSNLSFSKVNTATSYESQRSLEQTQPPFKTNRVSLRGHSLLQTTSWPQDNIKTQTRVSSRPLFWVDASISLGLLRITRERGKVQTISTIPGKPCPDRPLGKVGCPTRAFATLFHNLLSYLPLRKTKEKLVQTISTKDQNLILSGKGKYTL